MTAVNTATNLPMFFNVGVKSLNNFSLNFYVKSERHTSAGNYKTMEK
jgi:hypothetical protein